MNGDPQEDEDEALSAALVAAYQRYYSPYGQTHGRYLTRGGSSRPTPRFIPAGSTGLLVAGGGYFIMAEE